MRNLFIVPIERIGTRYTTHWFDYLPAQIAEHTNYNVHQFTLPEGDDAPENSAGGFFNFGFTCAYKSKQLIEIEKSFDTLVKDDDVFLFTDYWNPSVLFLRYIAAMKEVRIKIVGICHAGLWDPADMLSQRIGDKLWGKSIEESFVAAYDHLVFATEFSKHLYEQADYQKSASLHATGFPMEYYSSILPEYWSLPSPPEKENIVVFPHRKAREKRLDFFHQVEQEVRKIRPDIRFIVSLDETKTKEEYHNLLYKSKVAFSAATQETLGISMGIEAPTCGCVPLVPDRLSYAELFGKSPEFFIDDSSVESSVDRVIFAIDNYPLLVKKIKIHNKLAASWFTGYKFYSFLDSL